MPDYRAVFFDAGDTLIDFYSTGARVTRIVYERTGRQISAEQAAPYYDAAFHHALGGRGNGLWVTDEAAELRYWSAFYLGWLRAAGLPEDRALAQALVEDTINVEIYAPFPDSAASLQALRAAGLRLVLISNALPSMARIMRRLDLERHFDTCLYSCEVGYEKPGAEIFDLALSAADLPPAQTCFVDDVPGHVEAATSLGIRGFLLDRWERHPRSPLPRLTSLTELCARLGVGGTAEG
jgi:2-haloalkanoic acid dehalogenase type II